jgi:ligand-binding sensor protein
MNLAAQAMQTRQAVIEECDAGLAKIVIPIFVENEFVGAVGACGYLLDDGEVDSFLVNKMTDIDEDTVQELSVDIPTITTDGAKNLVVYIQKQIDILLRASHDQK